MAQMITFPTIAPARASRIAAALLNKHSAHEISAAIELLIDVLDLIGPPDEDNGDLAALADGLAGEREDAEPEGDSQGDQAWVEWHTMHGSQKKRGQNLLAGEEDDEEDDPAENAGDEHDTTNAEDDELCGAALQYAPTGPGCRVSDPDTEHDGREAEQMGDDVPMPHVYSLDHNLFSDKRQFLGIGNLMSSYVGLEVRSADTGKMHNRRGNPPKQPGSPG